MAEYSMSDFAKMQLDAAERVREMSRRSRDLTGGMPQGSAGEKRSGGRGAPTPPGQAPGGATEGRTPGGRSGKPDDRTVRQRPAASPLPSPPPEPAASPAAPAGPGWPLNLLSGLGNDRILILLLLVLLGDDGKDRLLLLALAYLAL